MPVTSLDPRSVILIGDRSNGPLHLGQPCGSLRSLVALQHHHDPYGL